MKQTFISILIIATTIVLSTGCKKNDDNTSPVNPVKTDSGMLYFHLHTNIGDSEVDDYNTIYTLPNGRQMSLSKAQMYLSDIQLVRQNGTTYTIPNVTILKTLETETYLVATVPVDTYSSVKFNVGLDAATNQLSASSNALLNHPEMWFSSSAQPGGYIFMNVQGNIDTTTNANGAAAQMQPFIYEIGTAAHYPQVVMPDHSPYYVVSKTEATYIHLIIDYSKLFNGVQLNNSSNLSVHSTADNSSAISNTITNNIPGMFRYEE